MDIDTVFFWLAVVSSGVLFVRMTPHLRTGRGLGWALAAAAILAVAGLGALFFPARAGTVAGSLWAIFILAPTLLTRAVARNALAQRYTRAQRLSLVIALLHPADGWRESAEFYRALALSQAGHRQAAVAALGALISRPRAAVSVVRNARAHLFRLRDDWEGLLEWTANATGEPQGIRRQTLAVEPNVVPMRVRALGESGRLGEMLAVFQAARMRMEGLPHPTHWPTCQLFLFAFCGREMATAAVLAGALAGLPPTAKEFWQATAQMAAGRMDLALPALRQLAAAGVKPDLRATLDRRLTRGVARAGQVLTPSEQELLVRLEDESRRDLAYQWPASSGLAAARATLLLIGLNVAMFAVEIARGGSENEGTLARLGALLPAAVLVGGEWYRLLAAMFLHFGSVHLAMNMFALAVIGPWVEQGLGAARYLVVYFVAGLGSMGAVLAFMAWGWMPAEILVGASGAIMGLIGAQGALLAVGWRRDRSRLAAQRLRGVLLVVALQVVFDILTPQVSFAAHAAGVVIGFIMTTLLVVFRPAGVRSPNLA
jgi:rhomboid protease GluP